MLLHEASIIATKERAEMKMSEFFIERKIVVDGAGHSITKRRAVKPLNASNRTQHLPILYDIYCLMLLRIDCHLLGVLQRGS